MGSIRRAPRTGRWEARYRDPFGAQRTATFDRKADATAFLATAERDKRQGEWFEPEAERVTVRQWHARWWPTIENSDRVASTLVQYESVLRLHVLRHLGDVPMASLPRIDVEQWLAALRGNGLGQSGVRTARTLLGMILSSAVESHVIRSSPLAGIKMTRRGPSSAKRALTVGQVEALADAACNYRVLMLVLAYDGLRPNEAFALRRRPRDDFGQLVVEEGLVEVQCRLISPATARPTGRAPCPSPAPSPTSTPPTSTVGRPIPRRWCSSLLGATPSVSAISAATSLRLPAPPSCRSGPRRTRCATPASR